MLSINSFTKRNMDQMDHSVRFVLVHGASHGSWCWYKIKFLLENAGHRVNSIDLAGAGSSPVDPNHVLSFHDYNRPLLLFLSSLPGSEKVVLVGHSAGGLSVTDACSQFPNKILAAVYIAATMLPFGFTSPQEFDMGYPQLPDEIIEKNYGMGTHNPPTSILVKKNIQREVFYQLSPPEDINISSLLSRPFPCIALTRANFQHLEEEVTRVYVKCIHDKAVSPENQDAMIRYWPPSEVICVESDHSPFFSAPLALSQILISIAASFRKS